MVKRCMLLLTISLVLTSILFADDIYFGKSNKVWRNANVLNKDKKNIYIQFNEKHGPITLSKPVLSVFGVVEKPIDHKQITKIDKYEWEEIKLLIKDKHIHFVYSEELKMGDLEEKLLKEINELLSSEYNANKGPIPIFEGLGYGARMELSELHLHNSPMSDEERLMHYYSKQRNAKPAAFCNLLGIASFAQGDYEFGFIIMACEIAGALLIAKSDFNDPHMRNAGFTLLNTGLIMSIVRPFDFAQKYNKALKKCLQFEVKN